jgi:adenine deaminase
MRALQMATIAPATYLNLDEVLGGIAPGRYATINVLPEIGDWRPEAVFVRGEQVDPRQHDLEYPPGYTLARPDPSVFTPLTGTHPVARYESAVINRRHDREVTGQDTQAMLVARDGSWVTKGVVENFIDTPGFATTATTSLHVLVLGTDEAAMARAAAKLAEQGGGFVFDGGWSAPLEVDGLIASGGFDKSVTIDRELSKQMSAAGYPFHDPLYSLLFASGDFLPEIRLTPSGVIEVKSRRVLADTVPA